MRSLFVNQSLVSRARTYSRLLALRLAIPLFSEEQKDTWGSRRRYASQDPLQVVIVAAVAGACSGGC